MPGYCIEGNVEILAMTAVVHIFHECVFDRQHTLMKDSADEDTTIPRLIKDNVLSLLYATKTRMDGTARAPYLRHLRNANKTIDETVEEHLGLLAAPHVCRVVGDIREIKFRQHRQPVPAHAVRLPVASTRLRIRARILPM